MPAQQGHASIDTLFLLLSALFLFSFAGSFREFRIISEPNVIFNSNEIFHSTFFFLLIKWQFILNTVSNAALRMKILFFQQREKMNDFFPRLNTEQSTHCSLKVQTNRY